MTLRSLALLATLGLAACSSAPTHYYTLVPTAPQHAAPVAAPGFQFEMLSVRMPVQVDQPQLVVRQSGGGLAILETERWGAPLADEFHDALAGQLEQKLGTRDLAGLPKATDKPVVSLQTDVRRFDSLPGQYALIDVVWSLSQRSDGQKRRSLTCGSVIREPSGVSMDELVLAHQKAIGQLATQIARAANGWACPAL
ncbi:PqiC family protein [Pseudomonas silvicola]|nr:PqiC family protein [Pseudomonas silvicola]